MLHKPCSSSIALGHFAKKHPPDCFLNAKSLRLALPRLRLASLSVRLELLLFYQRQKSPARSRVRLSANCHIAQNSYTGIDATLCVALSSGTALAQPPKNSPPDCFLTESALSGSIPDNIYKEKDRYLRICLFVW